jgi:peptidoglycan/LPS O-acetylase OafA/YrhL
MKIEQGTMAANDRWIPTLDGWRAIAVLMVIFCHELAGRPVLHPVVDYVLTKSGPLGVQLFFAISGYLICRLLLIEADKGGISLRAFYTRRAFRILPPALTYLAAISIASAIGIVAINALDIVSCIFLFANYVDKHWYVSHFWSLSIEEHFYLFWPLTLATLMWRRASYICIAGIVIVSGWRLYAGDARYFSPDNPWQRTDMVLDAFFAPCLLSIVLHHYPGFKSMLAKRLNAVVSIVIAGVLIAVTATGIPPAIKKSLQAVLLPLIVVSTVLQPNTWLGRILEFQPLAWIGRVSYSLYLWQQAFASPLLSLASMPFRIAGLFAVAAASYYMIERPMIKVGRRLLANRIPAVHTSISKPASARAAVER